MRPGLENQSAFSHWLRTGRVPSPRNAAGVELKFNPWHDPDDGRFTFANAGVFYGRGGSGGDRGGGGRSPGDAGRRPRRVAKIDPPAPGDLVITAKRQTVEDVRSLSKEEMSGFEIAAKARKWTARRENAEISRFARMKRLAAERTAMEKAGEEAWAKEVRDFGKLYAEDALLQAAGGAAGKFVIAPAARRAAPVVERLVRPQAHARKLAERASAPPPSRPVWVDENASMRPRAKAYNDSAPGARSNSATRKSQAPAIYRTTADGKRRPVRFDGFEDDAYPIYIDRKTGVRFTKGAIDQAQRQSIALRQNNAVGRWDVPDEKTKRAALKLLRKAEVNNISVKVIKE